ncbi:MAG: ABC transporter permease subunit [Planctomycetota bacterium]
MPVYDQSYRHWQGQIKARSARCVPIAIEGIRLHLKSKPSPFLNVLTRVMYVLSQMPFLFFLVSIYVVRTKLLGDLATVFDPSKPQYYPQVLLAETIWVLLFTVFIGSGLIARDLSANAIEGYLAKPLTVFDYVLGKFLVMAFFLACVTLFPCLILWLADWLLASEAGYLGKVLPQLSRIVIYCSLTIAVCSLTILAVSSLTKNAKNAALLWIGGNMVLTFLGQMLSRILERPELELISPVRAALNFGGKLFDLEIEVGASLTLCGLALLVYIASSAAILYGRVRAVAMRRE